MALATGRREEGFDALLELVERGTPADSRAAVEALGLFTGDAALERRVRAALDARASAPRRRRPRD